jgi:hypothetical protein
MFLLWPPNDRRWLIFERWMAALVFVLFTYNVLAWQGLVGEEPPWRPLTSVLVTGSLLLQSLAVLAQRRSQWLYWILLVASLGALGVGMSTL